MRTIQHRTLIIFAIVTLTLCGCTGNHSDINMDDPKLAAYVQLLMPAEMRILEWTKPVSIAEDGSPDGVEVILEARDSFDDLTKVVGTFQFELETRQRRDTIGERIAFWTVEVNTRDAINTYRDRLSRFYHFALELEHKPLPAGSYALTVSLQLPTGERLTDEHTFNFQGGSVPPPSAF